MKASIVWLLLALSTAAAAQDNPGAAARGFYGWYLPVARANPGDQPWRFALLQQGSLFAKDLRTALQRDVDARTASREPSLNFDPFLNSPSSCDSYQLGRVTQKGKTALVEVQVQCGTSSDATLELVQQDKRWTIANIRYPDGTNLRTLLDTLRKTRDKKKK